MASPFGQTNHQHDNYKLQKELERRGQGNLVQKKASSDTAFVIPGRDYSPKKIYKKWLTGDILIDRLYLNPATAINVPASEMFKYDMRGHEYKPENGYYGWAVWKTINHNFGLENKNDFLLELIDLHEHNINLEIEREISADYRKQVANLEVEGLDADRIILRGIFKRKYDYMYTGTYIEPTVEYVDAAHTIIKTNLIFRYTLYGGD